MLSNQRMLVRCVLHNGRSSLATITGTRIQHHRFSTSAVQHSNIPDSIAADFDMFKSIRQDIHMHPELGFEEFRTSGIVADRLKEFGVDHIHPKFAGTGVVATIVGKGDPNQSKDGSCTSVGLRADMDALPMQEMNEFGHKSTVDGKFHGCGHDGHTTMLLAAAKYLCETRNFSGNVNLIFQPGEEGFFGGREMVQAGLFDQYPCDEVYGMHNWPELPFGSFGIKNGPLMAAADEMVITVSGKGGHAAIPHICIDPVVISCHIVTMLQTLISRSVDPADSAVISVTTLHAGSTHNVIAETAELSGTIRTFNPDTRDELETKIKQMVEHVATAMGGSAVVNYERGYPATINNVEQARYADAAATKVVGDANVIRDFSSTMGAEDFSYFLNERPGCYAFIGQSGGPSDSMVHHPMYDFHDGLIPLGASWFANVVESRMPLN